MGALRSAPCTSSRGPPATDQVRGWLWPACYAVLVATALKRALPLHGHVALAAYLYVFPEETTSRSRRTLRPGRRGSLCSLFLGPLPPGPDRPWTRTWVLQPLPRSERLSCPACLRKGCAHSWPAAFPSHLNNPCVPAVHQAAKC